MSDDIVTRLRNIHTMGQLGVVHEAADEIEKLRDEIQVLRKLMFPRQNSEYRYFIHPDAVSDYLRVIRGD